VSCRVPRARSCCSPASRPLPVACRPSRPPARGSPGPWCWTGRRRARPAPAGRRRRPSARPSCPTRHSRVRVRCSRGRPLRRRATVGTSSTCFAACFGALVVARPSRRRRPGRRIILLAPDLQEHVLGLEAVDGVEPFWRAGASRRGACGELARTAALLAGTRIRAAPLFGRALPWMIWPRWYPWSVDNRGGNLIPCMSTAGSRCCLAAHSRAALGAA